MPFIGTTPTQGFVGANPKQSFTPNGSTTVFTLTNPVASANDLEVFVGNVRQEPTAAYTAAGTTLTMSEAPASGLNFYVINKSQAQVTTTPPDGSVGTAKITDNAISLSGSKVTGTLPVANGGTALTSGFLNGGITLGTGTSIAGVATSTHTGIPSTARMIRVNWFGLTFATGTYPEWRLGHSSANILTAYFNQVSYANHGGNGNVVYNNNANSFRTVGWTNANNTWYGVCDFMKFTHPSNGNTYWQQDCRLWNSGYSGDYGVITVRGFVNVGSNVIDRYYFGTSNAANAVEGIIQVGYI